MIFSSLTLISLPLLIQPFIVEFAIPYSLPISVAVIPDLKDDPNDRMGDSRLFLLFDYLGKKKIELFKGFSQKEELKNMVLKLLIILILHIRLYIQIVLLRIQRNFCY